MSHTKGTWYEDGLLFIGTDSDGNGRGGFRLQSGGDPYPESEVDANQRLCAAAPDLLAACEALLDEHYILPSGQSHADAQQWRCPFCTAESLSVNLQHDATCPVEEARAAITKAKGTTHAQT